VYGLVNKAIQDLVEQQFGVQAWQRIAEAAGFADGMFLTMEVYDDELTYRLVDAAAEILGAKAEFLLERFGEFWITYTATEGYGDLMDLFGSDFESFVANLDAMHARVGLNLPDHRPPSITFEPGSPARQHYRSQRPGLTPMVKGLLRGLARRFAADVEIHVEPRKEGADHETFVISHRSG
jgi:hypothetical protein